MLLPIVVVRLPVDEWVGWGLGREVVATSSMDIQSTGTYVLAGALSSWFQTCD